MPQLPHLILPRAEVNLDRRKRPGFGKQVPRDAAQQICACPRENFKNLRRIWCLNISQIANSCIQEMFNVCRSCLVVVLEVPQMLVVKFAILGGNALAIIRVCACYDRLPSEHAIGT